MTLDLDHVKNAIAEAAGIVIDDAEATAIARRLDDYHRAAAAHLESADAAPAPFDFAQALATAAPRHG